MAKLNHYIKCSSTIEFLSGFHIGGPKEKIGPGGIDNPVIRNPITQIPYIPGSSIKGRFRIALELKYNDVTKERDGSGPSQDLKNDSLVCKLFGSGSAQRNEEPTRLIFRDSTPLEGYEAYTQGEEKIEVKIDRQKMSAFHGGVRIQERIPAGAKFGLEITMRVFEGDDEEKFKKRLEEARNIVELEFLGGSGSRGYGQAKIEKFEFNKIEI